jgi:hypothetical protein
MFRQHTTPARMGARTLGRVRPIAFYLGDIPAGIREGRERFPSHLFLEGHRPIKLDYFFHIPQ